MRGQLLSVQSLAQHPVLRVQVTTSPEAARLHTALLLLRAEACLLGRAVGRTAASRGRAGASAMEGAAQQLARGPPPGQKAPRTRSRELALLLAGALVLALAVRHVSPASTAGAAAPWLRAAQQQLTLWSPGLPGWGRARRPDGGENVTVRH